jgi:tetratricopeptide (TPR) repeat protein
MRTTDILGIAIALLVGCGNPTPPPKNPKDVTEGGGGGGGGGDPIAAPVKAAPKRQVSHEAKGDFGSAIKAYKAAKKGGTLKSSCVEVAAGFGRVFDSHPKLPEAKFNEGVILGECDKLDRAEAAYQALLAKHPGFGPALNNLGELAFRRGQVDAATTYFRKAADVKNSEGYANLALMQRNQALAGNNAAVKDAIDNIHRALAVDSFNIEAYSTMALILYDLSKTRSQLEMARLMCVQATKVDDSYAPIYNTLGLILLRMQRVTPALAEFRKAAGLDPNFLEAHMNIGAITLSFRDYKSAEEAFTKALSLNPDKKMKMDALVGLGVAYRGQRKFKEAMAKYKEAEVLDPANVDVVYNMGILVQDYMFDASNPSAGIATLQQAANLLQRYASGGRNSEKIKDANKRIKNINEMVPMLQEQMKMAPAAPAGEPAAKPDKAGKPKSDKPKKGG